MTEPLREQAALISLGAQAVVKDAVRLGLTWRMRRATVAVVNSSTDIQVVQDGDSNQIGAIDLTGGVVAGDRVMCVIVPPGGIYIIGFLPTFNRGLLARIGTITTGAAIGAETVDLTTASFRVTAHRAYRVNYRGLNVSSTANLVTMRIRRTNAAGQLLSTYQKSHANTSGQSYFDSFYFIRSFSTNLDTTLCITLQASTGTVTPTGSASLNRYLEVYDAGSEDDYPDAIAIV